ncbi:hypothetical protein [Azospirillum soli]|uniref:hypothetical protein n=1 Tax=Azospirillum soli TaxID=1304799 RepID=UPI001AE971A9|nr:hypothetical protein [Azospirillum soli]MBP2312930.1 putative tellurite resistance protein B-like protein [Azospirillum soli]
MFLAQLEERQKSAFLVLADTIIQADGAVAHQEAAMLAAMKAEMGLPAAVQPDGRSITDAASVFDTRATKVAAVLELIGLSLVDGHVHDREASALETIVAAFGLPPTEFEVLRNWVVRQFALMREAAALMAVEA